VGTLVGDVEGGEDEVVVVVDVAVVAGTVVVGAGVVVEVDDGLVDDGAVGGVVVLGEEVVAVGHGYSDPSKTRS
jgi:hypothetical protein